MDIHKLNEFSKARTILEKLEKYGYEAYFVGGCVRDLILQRPIKDIDITTSATPNDVKRVFGKVIPVGISHGTVIVRSEKTSYEVTTFRNKSKVLENTFIFGTTLTDDLMYRDFTMNALAMDKDGNIIDLFSGQTHIENKLIKAVKDPYLRFQEDPLRMLRACRFASQLGFSIDQDTLKAIALFKKSMRQVAVERIKDEMTSLLTGPHFIKGLSYIVDSGLIDELPIFSQHKDYVNLLQKQQTPFISFVHMVTFLHYLNQQVTINKWIRLWKGSNIEKANIHQLHEAIMEFETSGLSPWLVYQLDRTLHKPFIQIIATIYGESITMRELQTIHERLVIHSRHDLHVDGHTLMKWFSHRKPGAWIEQMLQAIEKAVVLNELENKEQRIKEWILCHPLATN